MTQAKKIQLQIQLQASFILNLKLPAIHRNIVNRGRTKSYFE